jgi:Lysozyme like domain
VADAPIIPVSLLVVGGYLAWFGVHYWRTDVKWPSDPVKAALTGNPAPTGTAATPVHTTLLADVQALQPDNSSSSSTSSTGSGTDIGTGTQFTVAQLQSLWTANGGSSATSFIAAQVALAESSGNAKATSSNPDGGTNVGLWQLDTRGVGAGYTIAQLQDPGTNAKITVMHTANGTNWSEWADPVVKGGHYVGPTS